MNNRIKSDAGIHNFIFIMNIDDIVLLRCLAASVRKMLSAKKETNMRQTLDILLMTWKLSVWTATNYVDDLFMYFMLFIHSLFILPFVDTTFVFFYVSLPSAYRKKCLRLLQFVCEWAGKSMFPLVCAFHLFYNSFFRFSSIFSFFFIVLLIYLPLYCICLHCIFDCHFGFLYG